MKDYARIFLDEWVKNNLHNLPGVEDFREPIKAWADKLVKDAKRERFTEAELVAAVGTDLFDYLLEEYQGFHEPDY